MSFSVALFVLFHSLTLLVFQSEVVDESAMDVDAPATPADGEKKKKKKRVSEVVSVLSSVARWLCSIC